jgi:hypothetical protein
MRALLVGLFVLSCLGCSRPAPPPPEGPGLGEVMSLVGRRFEAAGRSFNAGRYELAAFEVDELGEIFEEDIPKATLPKEGPTAQIPAMAKAFLATNVPELAQAAASKDRVKFAGAFEHAAAACNACHAASAKAFIEVPKTPGQAVPVMDPVPDAPK